MNTQPNSAAHHGNRPLIDRFKLTYEDNHVSVFDCRLCVSECLKGGVS